MNVHVLPHVNAALNAAVTVLLVAGFVFIRRGQVGRHKTAMLSAFALSIVFLVSYLTYHAQAGATRFAGEGWIRPIYFTVLVSHTVLAAAILPLALVTLTRALRGQFDRHRRVARWTLPMWIYVGFTGSAVIYVLLYHLFPAR
jgi:putative membrane protein